VTELHERFEELAARGHRRGADAVIAAAMKATEDDAAIVAMPMTDGERPARRRGRSVVAASGIAALLGVATLSISALVGGTGADSPEAAVRQLADAISHEDPLAAIDVLSPVEVRQLRATVDAASRKAEELELVESAAVPLAGIDLSVEGLELDTEDMAPGFAKVYVRGGRITGAVDSSGVSALVRRAMGEASPEPGEVDLASLDAGVTPFVVAIQHDGSWYVSAAYTVLENLRVANDGLPADLGSARAAASSLGAASPEAAARDLLDAVAAKNWRRVIELAPPDELPVYDYRDFLLALPSDPSDMWTVDEFSAVADVRGDTAVVTVKAAVTIDSDDLEPYRARFVDDCRWNAFPGATLDDEQCFSIDSFGLFVPSFAGGGDDASLRSETITVDVVRREGRWFVSPVTTVLRAVDRTVAESDRRWLFTILGLTHELDPEATITLGQPIEATGGLRVYALEGRRGQELIGSFDAEAADSGYLDAELYAPDGSTVEDAWGWFQGETVRLPADGTYKVVVYEFAPGTYTFWSVADAPAEAFEPPYDELDGTCAATVEGSTECWTSAAPFPESGETVPVVPTTVP